MRLSPENQRWLDDFRERHGRLPRVLHIGNIANNAYNNARLLNEAGLDCDVICYDYYHIMGCPEWEDADFAGPVEDDFHPNWVGVDLGGFSRPHWFAQGPVLWCIHYLVAYRDHDNAKARRIWQVLSFMNRTATLGNTPLRYRLSSLKDVALSVIERVVRRQRATAGVRRAAALSADVAALSAIERVVRRMRAVVGKAKRHIFKMLRRLRFLIAETTIHDAPFWLVRRSKLLCDRYASEFADRFDVLEEKDFPASLSNTPWPALFLKYDFLIAYSTDPLIPMTLDFPYFAFEHGTIRDIPYETSARGRLTALSYRLARHVFVTNFDCVESAERLAPNRFAIINHPYDEDHGLHVAGSEELRIQLLSELDSDFIFFHPTRQDWVEGTGYADKSNDTFLRAFAALRDDGFRVGMVACAWGSNVEQSKALLAQRHCAQFVRWVAPMAIIPFERTCRATDVVVDQFKLGAFGGVVFKAMAVGTPILTYLDEQRLARQYVECPPVVNCRTTDEILARMKCLVSSPAELANAGAASREWMKKFHAKEATVNAQVDQFRLHPSISECRSAIE